MTIAGYYSKIQYYEEESIGPDESILEPEFIYMGPNKEPLYMHKCKKIKKIKHGAQKKK